MGQLYGGSGHRERIREKYMKGGYKGFLDYELLELLLTFSIKRRDVKPIAKNLMERFSTLENVIKSDRNSLKEVDGIGDFTGILLNLIGDISTRIYEGQLNKKDLFTVTGKNTLITYLRGNIAFNSAEQFMVLFLDTQNRIIETSVLFSGTIDRSAIYPREIIKSVIKYEAKSVIFAHNHPSGTSKPSKMDTDITRKLYYSLKEFDVRLLDHIIITKTEYFSFLENGII
ncbi:RadC family protein [Fusobacterium sp. PH5-44]|uniref:RadC family protein n=1 Tax=unclassified Fusobacterium TaxID=2648384 RepID=UPI003D1CBCFA